MSEVISYTIRTSSTLESNPWPSPLPDNTSHYRCKVSALARNGMETQTLNWSQHNGAGDSGSHCVHSESMVEKNWPALLILVAIGVTVMGNILVILAVSLEKKLQNATNYFLMSLAVADMLLGILVMPVSMVTILYDYKWPLPFDLCPIWIYLDVLFSTASIMHLCAISLDRYIAIRNPIHHSRFNSHTKARIKIMAVWTISVGISMPIPVLGLRDHSKVFKNGNCLLTDDNFVLVGSFIAFFVPLIIMIVTYFLTISALQNEATLCLDRLVPRPKWSTTFTLSFFPQSSVSSDKLFRRSISQEVGRRVSSSGLNGARCSFSGGMFGRRTMQSISNEQKASKVLGVVFFLFVVMWCPFFITNVLMVVCHHHICHPEVMEGLLNIFVWVGYLSSAVNPLVYTLFNKTYRTAFMRYIRCQYQPEKKPLQLILVNTIPPLAFNSSQLALGDMRKLQNGTMHCEKEGRGICLPGRETEQDKQSKCERDKDESSV
ncbi:5-hydroxytryptamine receptor 2A-like isoform X1 [Cyprinodon tularosa]|uniref:5-hydroxytryptamine receptor 2A-like isoform X1 n=1 Tax=Cyprinodon tularosa TaxID=77115 RepID=UPI0018E1FA23|nr:5-hydroxytryptamine receptor 2A-like isoform X1 [Cyprinodon tularosa]XP_038128426.1 5-hydroxytryptamine receptor 2A-like isoform X1 [Cyprinodon tularosa]